MIWDSIRWLLVVYVLLPLSVESAKLGQYLPVLKEDGDWWSYILYDPWRFIFWAISLVLLTYWQIDLIRRVWHYIKSPQTFHLWFGAFLSVGLVYAMLSSYRAWGSVWLVLLWSFIILSSVSRWFEDRDAKHFGFRIRRF
ncbi:MAG: hypothetical protein IMX04_06570 [Candidatus Carbobacillus altaicus]|nr:hypothetical protein [Candidatus Carbobacillus altaicus]